jgi:hypothetical protein
MKNIVSTTARVSSDRSGGNVLDDIHLFVGEETQWRISLAVTKLCLMVWPELAFGSLAYYGVQTFLSQSLNIKSRAINTYA